MNKTLIGKNNVLFLVNDASKELDQHCGNYIPNIRPIIRDLTKYLIIVFPNKSLLMKDFLPDEYQAKFRPSFDIYKSYLGDNMLDTYDLLKNEEHMFYKTDTHITLKANYIVYLEFIQKIKTLFGLNIKYTTIHLECKECVLSTTQRGIGDLTWPLNLGEQQLDDINDIFYYTNDFEDFYIFHKIGSKDNIKFLNKDLVDKTKNLADLNVIAGWDIISEYIIHVTNENCENKYKILIFYDSFLLNILPLYMELFSEIYFSKSIYNENLIKKINPDYVFEFRVERFLL